MARSKVYFTNLKIRPGLNLLKKLEYRIIKAGIGQIDFNNKIVAIKIHFGEPGNLAYLHPDTFWQTGIEHAVKIGLENTDYELINV